MARLQHKTKQGTYYARRDKKRWDQAYRDKPEIELKLLDQEIIDSNKLLIDIEMRRWGE